VLEDEKVH